MAAAALLLALLACVPFPQAEPAIVLWQPPPSPGDAVELRIEPWSSAVSWGDSAELRLRGHQANRAHCRWPGGESDGPRIQLDSPPAPGPLDIECATDDWRAYAQVSFTRARVLPLQNPYAGGVILLKLRTTPRDASSPVGRQRLGLGTLDARLQALDAWAFPAFPFDRGDTLDHVGLSRWIVVDLPQQVNFYQAVAWLRSDSHVYPESYLPQDAGFLRVRGGSDWAVALRRPVSATPRATETSPVLVAAPTRPSSASVTWDLAAIGAPEAWRIGQGSGVRIAIIDTGVDVNHLAISPNLRDKQTERPDRDLDRNGIPGDWGGVNFAHLALVRGEGPPFLALGDLSDVSDWQVDSATRSSSITGHGTALAAIAAGAGAGGRLGVAPRARILPIDIQENRRATASRLLDDDPRMRLASHDTAGEGSLRMMVWPRAAAVAYAVREGARVATCAWPASPPYWIIHDVLAYAEQNCVLLVCGTHEAEGTKPAVAQDFPANWGTGQDAHGRNASVYDAWIGEIRSDFFDRPLGGMIVVGDSSPRHSSSTAITPDLRMPLPPRSNAARVKSAASNPRNDRSPLPDRQMLSFSGPGVAVGLVAGGAALLTGLRPDLGPSEVREVLLRGARRDRGALRPWLPESLQLAEQQSEGRCKRRIEPARSLRKRLLQHVKIHTREKPPGIVPASSMPNPIRIGP